MKIEIYRLVCCFVFCRFLTEMKKFNAIDDEREVHFFYLKKNEIKKEDEGERKAGGRKMSLLISHTQTD